MVTKTIQVGKIEADVTYEKFGWVQALEIYRKCKENDWLDWDHEWYDQNGKLDETLANNYFF
jgi:hypothetical protein